MSLLFTDTFGGGEVEHKWDFVNIDSTGDPTARTNGWLGDSQSSTVRTATKQVLDTEEHTTFIAGAAYRRSSTATGNFEAFLFLSDDQATTHVTIWVSPGAPSGEIRAYRGTTAGTLLGSYVGSVMPAADTWYYLEAKVTLSDGGGVVEVKLDGTTVLTLTGVDTKNGGTKTVFDSFTLKVGSTGQRMWVCDVYLLNGAGSKNNNFLVAPRIFWLKPNGNGASSQGIGSDGNSTNNYQLVDDGPGPVDTADYVELVNTGDKDTYAFENISDVPDSRIVYGVIAWPFAQKTDSAARTLVSVARSGGSESDSPSEPLTNGEFNATRGVFENKPGGGSWTVGDINAMEFGYKAADT